MLKKSALLVILGLLVSSNAWAEMRSVRVKTANFREKPSTTADILFTADRYFPVRILERKRGWAKVKDFEGEIAWVAERLLRRKPTVVVTVPRANVRAEPRRNAQVLFKSTWSEAFPIQDQKGEWVLIQTADGDDGWIHRSIVWGDNAWDEKK